MSAACGGADAWVSGVYTFKGTLTYNADLTYTSNLGGTDAVHYHYPSSCLQSSSCDQFGQTLAAGGVTNLTCTTDATAATCDCDGVAPLASAGPDGTYTISGSTLTTVNAGGTTSTATYCVQGNVLRETGTPGDGGTTPAESIVLTRLVPL